MNMYNRQQRSPTLSGNLKIILVIKSIYKFLYISEHEGITNDAGRIF